MLLASNRRAIAAGLTTRPWMDTVRDTLIWARSVGPAAASTVAMTPDAEAALLGPAKHLPVENPDTA
jgi:hypothetical protein